MCVSSSSACVSSAQLSSVPGYRLPSLLTQTIHRAHTTQSNSSSFRAPPRLYPNIPTVVYRRHSHAYSGLPQSQTFVAIVGWSVGPMRKQTGSNCLFSSCGRLRLAERCAERILQCLPAYLMVVCSSIVRANKPWARAPHETTTFARSPAPR